MFEQHQPMLSSK